MNDTTQSQGMLIRDMTDEQRPRERAMKYGVKSLSTTELMAIIFGTGVSGKSVIQLSDEILADNDGHISKVARLTVKDLLQRYKGIGPAKAIALLAALEVGARAAADAALISDPQIRTSAQAADVMRPHFRGLTQEEFWIMLLNQAGRVIREINISRGGLTATAVDVKVIMRHALEHYATAMILFHNHPSGNLSPSPQDDHLTRHIVEAAKLFDIRVNDHIIITDGSYYSYNDNGHMPS